MLKTTLFQFRVTLCGSSPAIWRRFQIRAEHSFYSLHEILQIIMGWDDEHSFLFLIDGQTLVESQLIDDVRGQDAQDFCLDELFISVGQRGIYRYDLGDAWEHELLLESIISAETPPDYPRCLAGANACPPENCAGIEGYNNLLDVLADKAHVEHAELAEWVGHDFDAAAFDLAKVNLGLAEWVRQRL